MGGKLRDYQVLDVLCGGTFYKVKHKVTNKIFAWRAHNCSAYSNEEIKNITDDVAAISKVQSDCLLQYYETLVHAPSKTLYFVVEYNCWQSLSHLLDECSSSGRHIAETFLWHLLRELAAVCKLITPLKLHLLSSKLTLQHIFVGENCELRVDCFSLEKETDIDLIQSIGWIIQQIISKNKISDTLYSDDLFDVIDFVTRNKNLNPDIILYHPTVLTHLETLAGPKHVTDILVSDISTSSELEISIKNKCDSEKAVELSKVIEPLPRRHLVDYDSPIYSNVSPKRPSNEIAVSKNSLSPTIQALALELPGFVPRSRKPISQALTAYKPQQVSEETLSQQWMTRLIALRQREESLNKRERDLIKKEIYNSPNTKFIPLRSRSPSPVIPLHNDGASNGITLPPIVPMLAEDNSRFVSRRRHRRSSSVRTRSQRKSLAYEDLDSSLSAAESSMIVTAAKITKDNMPRRNIFPETSTKKVHFTSVNPFVESDESVTLTFYELENVDSNGYQVPRNGEKNMKDINKFKYLDLEKLTSEKRAAMQWTQSSPSKQPKYTKKTLPDITNINDVMKRSPSKASLTSKGSNSSRYSMGSSKSQWSMESAQSGISRRSTASKTSALSKVSEGNRFGAPVTRQSMMAVPQTPAPEKKAKRKSLLPFKTPFKFMTSAKIV